MNLLQETIQILKEHNKTLQDVLWIGSSITDGSSYRLNTRTTVEDFVIRANQNYDDGYGREEVNMGLIVVGENFWLERHEYDGSEWWEYKEMPNISDFDDNEGHVPIFYRDFYSNT